jgi:hypothetical protein
MNIPAFVEACFESAEQGFQKKDAKCFQFGPFHLEHRGLGQASLSFFRLAVAHLERSTNPSPDFIVYTIDAQDTGIFLPKPCWDWKDVDGYGVIKAFAEQGFYADYQFDFDTFTLIDTQQRRALQWSKSVRKLPEWERSFPFRKMLYHFTKNTNCLMLHAGAVGTAEAGVLLAGAGGSGKSSSTLACLGSDLLYAGDDFVLLDVAENRVHSLYNVAKLDEKGINLFPRLEPYLFNRDKMPEQKGQVFLWNHFPEQLIPSFPLQYVLLPKFSGTADTRLIPASSADALRALAPSTLGLLKADEHYFAKIASAVRKWPSYHFQTGTELQQISASISNLLKAQ